MSTLTTVGTITPSTVAGQNNLHRKAARPGFLTRLWSSLADYGQRRAAAEVARHVRVRGLRATGDIATDAARLAASRGLKQPS